VLSKRTGVVVLVTLTLVVIIAAILAPRIAQPLAYHNFVGPPGLAGHSEFR
jgi:hypothetical protein